MMKCLVASLTLLTLAAPAAHAMACAPRDAIVDRLSQAYGEVFSGGGLQGEVAVYEVWTSPQDGSWTILLTRADGVSCIMASGTDWQPQLASHRVQGVPS